MSLKEQLAAKKAAEAVAPEEQAIAAAAVEELKKISEVGLAAAKPAEKQPEPDYEGPQFRKGSFAYQFKYSRGVIKCDKAGVYTPKTAEEFEILKHAVKAGNILFN